MTDSYLDTAPASDVCAPVDSVLCGDQGTIVTAVAYLDSHYQLDPDACNIQVVLPWIWLARFAAELTYQSAAKALLLSEGKAFKVRPKHDLTTMHSYWCEALTHGNSERRVQSLRARSRAAAEPWAGIEAVDINGLMFRYPLGHPERSVPPMPAGFAEHCDWPLDFRRSIAMICDLTIAELPESSERCRNAFRHLRCAAAAGDCLAGYNPAVRIDRDHDFRYLLDRHPSEFELPVSWHPVVIDGIHLRNWPVPPELVERLLREGVL